MNLLKEIKISFEKKDDERLKSLLSSAPFVGVRDPAFHEEVAKILNIMGETELSKKELELSIRDNTTNLSSFITLAELYVEEGEHKKGIDILRRGIELFPQEEELYIKLGNIYEARGELGALNILYKLAYEKTNNSYFREKVTVLRESQEEEETWEPKNIHLVKFLSLFRGRDGVYARQWIDNNGNTGYSPIREPFTLKVAKNHILGNYTVGLYQLREDNTIMFLVFDIDIAKRFLGKYLSSQKIHREIDDSLKATTLSLMEFLKTNGINAYVEDSGFKGYHIWIFFDSPLPSALGKAFGAYVLKRLHLEEEMIHVEVFPKQASLKKQESLGNLIKLPLGIHKRSGRRALFLSEDLSPLKDQFSFLLAIEKTKKEKIEDLYDKLKEEIPPVRFTKETEIEEKEEEFTLEEDKEFNILIKRCPVIGTLWEKVCTGGGLNGEESTVIIFTLGHLTNGPKIVNTILRRAGIFNEKSYLKSRLNSNPMGCPKIRKKIPYITVNVCKDCFSGIEIGTYPNPLLHLKVFEKEEKDIEAMVFEYIDLMKKYRVLKSQVETSRNEILSYMEERGLEKIELDNFVVGRTEDGNDLYIRARSNPDKKA